MKFSEMTYTRPDVNALLAQLEALTARVREADSAAGQLAAYKERDALMSHFNTLSSLCSIRNTVDTRDKFYEEEQAWLDEQYPLVSEKNQDFGRALYESKFRPQ